MNDNTECYLLCVAFVAGTSEPMTHFRFSRFPHVGDAICGDEHIYTVDSIQHCNGLAIDSEPYVTVVLRFSSIVG
jgi:hypothetical protein